MDFRAIAKAEGIRKPELVEEVARIFARWTRQFRLQCGRTHWSLKNAEPMFWRTGNGVSYGTRQGAVVYVDASKAI